MRKNEELDNRKASRILGKLSRLYSPEFGLVNGIMSRHELDKYGFNMYQCLTENTTKLFSLKREISSGGLGVDKEKRKALLTCIGEAVERYCVSYFDEKTAVFARYSGLNKSLKPNTFDLYSDAQYSTLKNDFANPRKDKIHWSKLSGVFNKKKRIFWPSSLIYMPFEKSKAVAEVTSTGVAAHSNKNEAILGGIMEILERDSLMISFLNRLPVRELDISSAKEQVGLISKIEKDYQIRIFEIQNEMNFPVYFGIIWNKLHSGNIHFGIGAASCLNTNDAITKTLKECLFTHFYSKKLLPYKQSRKEKINKLHEHYLYYQGNNFKKIWDLIPIKDVILYTPRRFTLNTFKKRLLSKKLIPYYIDVTTDDMKSLGLYVVRVVIPKAVDLSRSFNLQRLGAKRLKEVPVLLGYKSNLNPNEILHPFP